VLVHDTVAGLILTKTFDKGSPGWYQVNSGLTTTQFQSINHIIVCPNGAVYVGHIGDDLSVDAFIARASYAGSTFTIIHDQASLNTLLGTTGRNGAIMSFNFNPLSSESVVMLLNNQTTHKVTPYLGDGTTFGAGIQLDAYYNQGSISYGQGQWVFTTSEIVGSHAYIYVLSADLQTIISQRRMPDETLLMYTMILHTRIGTTGNIVHRINRDDFSLSLSTDNTTDFIHNVGSQLNAADGTVPDSAFAMSADGQNMMARWSASNKGKSSDGGYSWSDIGNLPTLVPWVFEYAGNSALSSKWIAARSYVYYSKDFSISAWIDKRGNILNINPLLDIDFIKVVP
jgi:hypothetical protein